MVPGTVSIDDTGAATGSGIALALYTSILTIETTANPLPDPEKPDADFDGTPVEWRQTFLANNVRVKRAWAREAQRHADVLASRTVASQNTTSSISLDTDTVVSPARAGNITLSLPAGAPIGWECEVIEVGNDVVHTVTVGPPGGELLAGATAVPVLSKRRFVKYDATHWIGYV